MYFKALEQRSNKLDQDCVCLLSLSSPFSVCHLSCSRLFSSEILHPLPFFTGLVGQIFLCHDSGSPFHLNPTLIMPIAPSNSNPERILK